MEHRFYEPDENDRSVANAFHSDVLKTDWEDMPNLMDFVSPETTWFGFPHDEAPFVSNFSKYPESLAWNTDQIWNGHLHKGHASLDGLESIEIGRQVVAFLQSWLYYGTLEAFLGKKVNVSFLMRPNRQGCPTLYTRNLHTCLQAKTFNVRVRERDRKEIIRMEMGQTLQLARDWVLRLSAFSVGKFKEKMDRDYPDFIQSVTHVVPALVRLVEALLETMLYIFGDWPMQSLANLHVPMDAVESRRERLRNSGWCKFQINLLESTTNQSTMDWLVNTSIRQDTPGHEQCTEQACDRNNVEVSTYQQLHCKLDCTCNPLSLHQEEIEDILEKDQLPVICVIDNNGPSLSISAAEKGTVGDYVAISHVWVDGLGGSKKKELLKCQVLRIQTLVNKVMGRGPEHNMKFWIDSLCIPSHASKFYIPALIGIRDVYSSASAVLVIDRLIQQCSSTAPMEILFASIYMSAWMQRMWTYEEAILARRLVFLLADESFHEYNTNKDGPTMRPTVSVVWKTLGAHISRLQLPNTKVNIGHVYHAFRFRLTNAKGDEFLSIASMLGFSAQRMKYLEEVKKEERVKRFWLTLKNIPANVIFTEGPKLPFCGFRWAPSTFMFPTVTKLDTNLGSRHSTCTEDGLFGEYLHLQLDRVLHGCNKYPHATLLDRVMKGEHTVLNQNFMIWVEGNRTSSNLDEKGIMIRVYCDESWPTPPSFEQFDSVIILTMDNEVPKPGQMWPGVALLRGTSQTRHEDSAQEPISCDYVQRVVVERLRMEEVAHATPTIMHTGSDYTVVEARASLSVANLHIR